MCGCNSVMKRMTREISSILYIFLPYLSFNLGGLLDTLEGHTVGVDGKLEKTGLAVRWSMAASRFAGAMCPSTSEAQWVPLTCRLVCQLPIDQILKLPFFLIFLEFLNGEKKKHFVILFPYFFDHELRGQDSFLHGCLPKVITSEVKW